MEQFQKEAAVAAILCFFSCVCLYCAGIARTESREIANNRTLNQRAENEDSKSAGVADCIRF